MFLEKELNSALTHTQKNNEALTRTQKNNGALIYTQKNNEALIYTQKNNEALIYTQKNNKANFPSANFPLNQSQNEIRTLDNLLALHKIRRKVAATHTQKI